MPRPRKVKEPAITNNSKPTNSRKSTIRVTHKDETSKSINRSSETSSKNQPNKNIESNTRSKKVESITSTKNDNSTIGYSVCIFLKDHFDHKEFDSLESAERFAKKTSKQLCSVSVHKCTYETIGNRRREVNSELISMFMEGEKCD